MAEEIKKNQADSTSGQKKKENGTIPQKVESDTFKKEVLTEKDLKARDAAKQQNKKKKQKRRRMFYKIGAGVAVLVIAVSGWNIYQAQQKKAEEQAEIASNTTKVMRSSISSELTGSGTLEAKDTYSITTLVEGEIIADYFSEGDVVEEGQILYEIDSSSMESTLQDADTTLLRAQSDYEDAEADLSEIQSKYSGNTYKSTESGYIKTLYIKAGDKVSSGTKIADIYDDTTMLLKVPFLSLEAQAIPAGADVVVTLSNTGEQIPGKVKSVSSMDETLNGGVIVRYVTVYVTNPGGLSTSDYGMVSYADLVSVEDAVFTPNVETVMSADLDGNVEVEALLVNEGSYVTQGQSVFKISQDSMDDLIRTYEKNLENAEDTLGKAKNSQEDASDTLEDYTITAPISGTVISKTSKAGDNISKGSSGTTTMAEIYDLSELTFEMSIDELDIDKVEVGQKVKVVADAYEDQEFEGEVTNVSLLASNANGVTNYPVTVTIKDAGNLLPGMNVDGTIVLSESEDTLVIPADALQRGNVVYVKKENAEQSSEAAQTDEENSAGQGDQQISDAVQERTPEGFTAVTVEVGVINDDYVEILSGLSEGDEIYYEAADENTGFGFMMGGGMVGMGGAPSGGPSGRGGGGPRG